MGSRTLPPHDGPDIERWYSGTRGELGFSHVRSQPVVLGPPRASSSDPELDHVAGARVRDFDAGEISVAFFDVPRTVWVEVRHHRPPPVFPLMYLPHLWAQEVLVTLTDDLDASDADETIMFALDGASYEIDLNAKNAVALRKALHK